MLFEITVQEFNHQLNIGQLKYLWHLETEWSLNKTILYSQYFAKYHVGWKDKNFFQHRRAYFVGSRLGSLKWN